MAKDDAYRNGIELKVGKLCGEIDGIRDAHAVFRKRTDDRLDNHGTRISGLEKRVIWLTTIAALAGSLGGQVLPKLLSAFSS